MVKSKSKANKKDKNIKNYLIFGAISFALVLVNFIAFLSFNIYNLSDMGVIGLPVIAFIQVVFLLFTAMLAVGVILQFKVRPKNTKMILLPILLPNLIILFGSLVNIPLISIYLFTFVQNLLIILPFLTGVIAVEYIYYGNSDYSEKISKKDNFINIINSEKKKQKNRKVKVSETAQKGEKVETEIENTEEIVKLPPVSIPPKEDIPDKAEIDEVAALDEEVIITDETLTAETSNEEPNSNETENIVLNENLEKVKNEFNKMFKLAWEESEGDDPTSVLARSSLVALVGGHPESHEEIIDFINEKNNENKEVVNDDNVEDASETKEDSVAEQDVIEVENDGVWDEIKTNRIPEISAVSFSVPEKTEEVEEVDDVEIENIAEIETDVLYFDEDDTEKYWKWEKDKESAALEFDEEIVESDSKKVPELFEVEIPVENNDKISDLFDLVEKTPTEKSTEKTIAISEKYDENVQEIKNKLTKLFKKNEVITLSEYYELFDIENEWEAPMYLDELVDSEFILIDGDEIILA